MRRRERWVGDWVMGVGLVMGLAACGGAQSTPTPIPASAVRPEQPTPVYAGSTAFTLATPVAPLPTAAMIPADAMPVAAVSPVPSPQTLDLTALQPPSTGMGILRGAASVVATPGGATIAQLPGGAVVTLTGKSADGAWVAAYTEDGVSGWLAVNRLTLFGAEALAVVTEAVGPGLAATMVAEAMTPIAMPTIVLTLTVTP